MSSKADMELLAPAGNLENFHAALEAGADAVYIGAPGINARNLSRDLTFEEIGAMIEFSRNLGKKVYLAANSLILERDIPALIETLSLFEYLKPDALIVQDLALIRLIHQHFPTLTLHASTLMGAHNSDTVQLFSHMGCTRVVLARELTLKEIVALKKKVNVELEVFVHGAMCYSYSGLCLFSSFLGGKSGLRGRCVQPCRRGYTWSAPSGGRGNIRGNRKTGGRGGSFLFSMNDLAGFEAIASMKKCGVASIKIEGRLRSANYVSKITEAYRRVIDARENDLPEAIKIANLLAEEAMARKTSAGYFFSPQPQEAIVPYHSGNLGLHLGSFSQVRFENGVFVGKITLKKEVHRGDRVRVHVEATGERKAFTLHKIIAGGKYQEICAGGRAISIELPEMSNLQKSKVELYRVDVGGGAYTGQLNETVMEVKKRLAAIKKNQQRKNYSLKLAILGTGEKTTQKDCRRVAPAGYNQKPIRKGPKKSPSIEIWLRTDSPQIVTARLPFTPDKIIMSMEKGALSQSALLKKQLGKNVRNFIWALPPIILERDLGRYSKQVGLLIRSGFKNFQIAHIGQTSLFGRERVHLYGDYTLNLANSQALQSLAAEGFEGVQASIELDKHGYSSLVSGFREKDTDMQGSSMKIGLTVYGKPPLFTSRLGASHFQYKKNVVSPKGEEFFMYKQDGMILTLPVKPFSLLPYLQEIQQLGIDYAVVDISRMKAGPKELSELAARIQAKAKVRKLPTFNYLGRLE